MLYGDDIFGDRPRQRRRIGRDPIGEHWVRSDRRNVMTGRLDLQKQPARYHVSQERSVVSRGATGSCRTRCGVTTSSRAAGGGTACTRPACTAGAPGRSPRQAATSPTTWRSCVALGALGQTAAWTTGQYVTARPGRLGLLGRDGLAAGRASPDALPGVREATHRQRARHLLPLPHPKSRLHLQGGGDLRTFAHGTTSTFVDERVGRSGEHQPERGARLMASPSPSCWRSTATRCDGRSAGGPTTTTTTGGGSSTCTAASSTPTPSLATS